MAYDTSRAVPPQTIGFLLLDQFTLISLASAVEPLRMANQLTGQELYRWHTFSLGGAAGVGKRRHADHSGCVDQ